MPNTVKRNYPYPALQGEPPNIPLALENLANAIETDLENVTAQIPAGTVNELESRAALMEGRLTNLEHHQVRTGSQTITSQWSQGESSLSFTIPANTILCAIDSVQTDANGYAGGRFGARLYCSVNGNTARVSSSNSDVRVRAATIIYAYYA